MSQPGDPQPTPLPPDPDPWRRITVGVPGIEFEASPPGQYDFDRPDTECDGWSTPELTVRYASVRGAMHRYYRKPRQDTARAALHEATGTVAFAVADGLSSAVNSELGALEACRAALEHTLHLLAAGTEPVDFAAVARHAAERLRQLAKWRLSGRDPQPAEVASRYATTLVTGVVRPCPGGAAIELCRIGDSAAWLLDRSDGRFLPLFGTKTGSDTVLVSNEVTPLPTVPDPVEQVRVRLAPHQALLAGTDGFADPLGDGHGQVGALFTRHLRRPPDPLWLAHVLDFSRETFDDDRTLLVVWPRDPAAPR
ncbi:protein phosphatase 2C domain-containing protein [Kitasatospora sp. NPDC006697]|uniref:protein phosphatase 2C domain-containing protein n=1 Tax=Kitasatospora sp. NPDC006697 TaxID=3364020 RepID=UPI003698571C